MPHRRTPSTTAKRPVKMCSGCGNPKNRCTCLEDMLAQQMKFRGFPEPVTQFKFHPKRRWKTDFSFPDLKIIIECEGGVFGRGRHTSPVGFTNDCSKYNAATAMGYRVFRFTGAQIRSGEAITFLEEEVFGKDES